MLLRALIAFLVVCGYGPAAAQTPHETARVSARLTVEGLRAEFELSQAVTEFQFAEADVVRDTDFAILTEGLTLRGDTISASRPFRRFTVLVRPATQERDAKYPAFYRVGEGGVLYAPALTAAHNGWRTTLRLRTARGHVTIPADGPDEEGFVYVGPRSLATTTDQIVLITAPGTPPAFYSAAVDYLSGSMQFYAERLGVPLHARATLVLTHGREGSGFVGDVTPGPVVSLRFYGDGWSAPGANERARLSRFIAHETFHFWNGSLASPREGTPSWLHEGGAEYAALLSGRAAGDLSDADVLNLLSDAMTNCRSRLRFLSDVGMNDLEFLSSGVRYPCGLVIQWAADLAIRAQSAGARDVLDAWGHVTRLALTRADRGYDLADFTAYEGMANSAAVIEQLAVQSGPERWTALTITLRALGASIEEQPSNMTRRHTLLLHLGRQSCATGSPGFGIAGDRVTIDAECGVFAGGQTVTRVEDGDPAEVSPELYARVQAVCAAEGDLTLVLSGVQRVTLPCRTTLSQPENAYVVEASSTLN